MSRHDPAIKALIPLVGRATGRKLALGRAHLVGGGMVFCEQGRKDAVATGPFRG